MIKIEIDQKLYSFLQKKAIPFVETPNDTLKRLLNFNSKPRFSDEKRVSKQMYHTKRIKRPRTNLHILVEVGLLEEGQEIYMTNYSGNIIKDKKTGENERAIIKNGKIYYNNDDKSLSSAAKIILMKNGYSPDAIRGPKMWKTNDGKSIMELWNQYLDDHEIS